MQREDIDIQLWEYIDGTCNQQDRERIEILIAENEAWATAYEELQAFNNSLSEHIPSHQASTSFVANTMHAITASQHKPAKRYINTWVTKGIAAFFVLSIGSILLYTLATQIDWSLSPSSATNTPYKGIGIELPSFNFDWLPSNGLLNALAFVAALLALVMIDKLIKHNRLKPTS